jgi:hypothetical protein
MLSSLQWSTDSRPNTAPCCARGLLRGALLGL